VTRTGQTNGRYYLLAYGAAVLATVLATLARLALTPLVGSAIPFVTFFAAAILLAWFYGFWPAALSIVLAAFSGAHYILGNRAGLSGLWGRTERAAVIGFVAASATVSFLIDFQRRTLIRAQTAEKAQTAIAAENALLLRESQRAHLEVTRSNEELKLANRDLEIFAYSASHDLKEPLRTIAIYTEMIQRNFARQMAKDDANLLHHVLAAARRMNNIIDDLLLYTRATKSEEGPAPNVDASLVIADVLEDLRGQIADAGATVTTSMLPPVAIHKSCLTQIFQNLISNSVKYRGEEPPSIHISSQRMDGWCVFSVADNGIGIEPEYGQQIFGLFKRLHRHEEYPGNGIGLAICQRLVEHYGGRIWLEKSELGAGSTFCFSVPATQPSPVTASDPMHLRI
jgi:signal transduction histidine kinase